MSGITEAPSGSSSTAGDRRKLNNYKLIADPSIDAKHKQKVYRVEGIILDKKLRDQYSYEETVVVKDPRRNPQQRYRSVPFHQTVKLLPTRFVIDANYTGTPPEVEVLLENLNDNVREDFLRTLLKKHNFDVVHLSIAYHPSTKRHLGLAHVELTTPQSADACIIAMNGRAVMGNVIHASKDPLGKKYKACIKELIAEQPKHNRSSLLEPPAPPSKAQPPPPPPVDPPQSSLGYGTPVSAVLPSYSHSPSVSSVQNHHHSRSSWTTANSQSSVVYANGFDSHHHHHHQHQKLPPLEEEEAPRPPRPSLHERITMLFKSGRGPFDESILKEFQAFGEDCDEEGQKEKRKEVEGSVVASMSPIRAAPSPPAKRGSRFGQLPKGPLPATLKVPLAPPGVVILNVDADQKPLPTIRVEPKANLLSQLFLHSGLYNLPSIPHDVRAFYPSYFRPLLSPYQVQGHCFAKLMEDMKTVITRDLERRIIHTHLFRAFDAWTEKHQREYNQRMSIRNIPTTTSITPHVMDITNTVDKILSGDISGGGPLSLRNALKIHKMPSFRKPKAVAVAATSEGQENEPQEGASSAVAKEKGENGAARSLEQQPAVKEEGQRWKVPEEPLKSKKRKKERQGDKKRRGGQQQEEEEAAAADVQMVSLLPDTLLKADSSNSAFLTTTALLSSPHKDKKRKSSLEQHSQAEREAEKALLQLSRSDIVTKRENEEAISRKPILLAANDSVLTPISEGDPFSALDLLLAASEIVEEKDKAQQWAQDSQPPPAKKKKKTTSKLPALPSHTVEGTDLPSATLPLIKKKVPTEATTIIKEKIAPWKRPFFEERSPQEKESKLAQAIEEGIDGEDIGYLKAATDELLAGEEIADWLRVFHWVDHPATLLSVPGVSQAAREAALDKWERERPSEGGCGRCSAYKRSTRRVLHLRKNATVDASAPFEAEQIERVSAPAGHHGRQGSAIRLKDLSPSEQARRAVVEEIQQKERVTRGKGLTAREARMNKRRLINELDYTASELGLDIGKFCSLKQSEAKRVRFGRSKIHNWGLFAQETIAPDEMVIEYIGEKIRAHIADLREKRYEKVGIGSSYLFRVDDFSVIDATKCGNYARFMNHCCTPNSYAKVISVDGQKKIVIFSKQQINAGEEITYDYKFPIEDNKIPCLCGSKGCRGSLN